MDLRHFAFALVMALGLGGVTTAAPASAVTSETIAAETDVAWAKRKGHKWKAFRGRGHHYGWRNRGRHYRSVRFVRAYAYPRRFYGVRYRPAYRYRYARPAYYGRRAYRSRYARPVYYGRPAYSYRYRSARPAYGRVVVTGSAGRHYGWGRGRHRGWR